MDAQRPENTPPAAASTTAAAGGKARATASPRKEDRISEAEWAARAWRVTLARCRLALAAELQRLAREVLSR
jgi:hypothetical protein